MMNVEGILDFIQSIKTAYLGGKDSQEIALNIESIRSKKNDPKLYLAVIGEFSSGKSTFINALLGFRLLKDAVMPTTACATYIESSGNILSINGEFFDGKKFHATETEFQKICQYLQKKHNILCNSLTDVISIITSDQKVAKTVKSLSIKVPGNAIPKNIVIIDTPGFNPGSDSVNNHQEITRYVVENIADAAIILTPQEQAMSATLSRFLNANLKRCLHRCIYVVTKLDTIDEEVNRHEILSYAKQRIVSDLNVVNPSLFGLSAITMLPVKRIPMGKEDEWPVFQSQFKSFMRQTWLGLQRSKSYVLSEHISILVKDIAALCAEKLKNKQSELLSDKQFLESHKVETIQTVTEKMVLAASNAMHETLSRISYSFYGAETTSRSKAESIVKTGTMTLSNFKTIMMPQIKQTVESEARSVLTNLNASLNNE